MKLALFAIGSVLLDRVIVEAEPVGVALNEDPGVSEIEKFHRSDVIFSLQDVSRLLEPLCLFLTISKNKSIVGYVSASIEKDSVTRIYNFRASDHSKQIVLQSSHYFLSKLFCFFSFFLFLAHPIESLPVLSPRTAEGWRRSRLRYSPAMFVFQILITLLLTLTALKGCAFCNVIHKMCESQWMMPNIDKVHVVPSKNRQKMFRSVHAPSRPFTDYDWPSHSPNRQCSSPLCRRLSTTSLRRTEKRLFSFYSFTRHRAKMPWMIVSRIWKKGELIHNSTFRHHFFGVPSVVS